MNAPLLEWLDAHDRRMTWFEDFLAKCAMRKARRENVLSPRAKQGWQTRRANQFREGERM